MKPWLYFFIICVFISSYLSAQTEVTGQIVDQSTGLPLSYANIGIVNSSLGTVSDEEGRFKIVLRSPKDRLFVSYLGYTSAELLPEGRLSNRIIPLVPSSIMIDELEVVASRFKEERILGVRNVKGRGSSVGYGNPQLGTELGTVIRVDKETFLKSVHIVLNHAKGDSLLFRINFYDYSDEVIGEKMVRDQILLKEKQRKGTYSIDLQSRNIILKNDILVSVEWLKNFDGGDNSLITFDTKKSRKDSGVFIRASKTSDFIQLKGRKRIKPCIYLVGLQGN